MARLSKKAYYKEDTGFQPELMFKKARSLYNYEEYDLIDIDKIVRYYIQNQRDKKTALCNVATIINNIIDSAN